MRPSSGGCRPPKYLKDVCPPNIWGVYDPKIFDGCMSVKYLGGLHPQNISRMSVKYLTHAHASVIRGVWTPKIFDGCVSVKLFWGVYSPKLFD